MEPNNRFEKEDIKLRDEVLDRDEGFLLFPDEISMFPVGLIHGHYNIGKEDIFQKELNMEIIRVLNNSHIYSVFVYDRIKINYINFYDIGGNIGFKTECLNESTGEIMNFEYSFPHKYSEYLSYTIEDNNELLVLKLKDKTFEICSTGFPKWFCEEPDNNHLLYVGQSKNMLTRLRRHEKINEIFSYLSSFDSKKKILIGTFNIKFYSPVSIKSIGIEEGMNLIDYENGVGSGMIDLFEAFWISKLKPEYNKQHMKRFDINSRKYKNILEKLSYTKVPFYSYYTFLHSMPTPYGKQIEGVRFNTNGEDKYYQVFDINYN